MTDIDFTIEELEGIIADQEDRLDEYGEFSTAERDRFTGQLIWKCRQQIKRILAT